MQIQNTQAQNFGALRFQPKKGVPMTPAMSEKITHLTSNMKPTLYSKEDSLVLATKYQSDAERAAKSLLEKNIAADPALANKVDIKRVEDTVLFN